MVDAFSQNPVGDIFGKMWLVLQPLFFGLIGTEVKFADINVDLLWQGVAVIGFGLIVSFLQFLSQFQRYTNYLSPLKLKDYFLYGSGSFNFMQRYVTWRQIIPKRNHFRSFGLVTKSNSPGKTTVRFWKKFLMFCGVHV